MDLGNVYPVSAWHLSQVSKWWRAWRSTQQRWRCSSWELQLLRDLQTLGVVHLHPSLLLSSILEKAASPNGLWKVPQGWRGHGLTGSPVCFLLQDYIFYLEPDKLESGKGKCSYDPKVDTVSALISKSCSSLGLALPVLGGGNM